MARIRTIKPEFPHSESMGRVSRDSRLCFILLWTLADDSGRLRGNSRMLASLLFPYDSDASSLMDDWLSELERESCIHRYSVDGSTFIQIAKWLSHQKIDKPSQSKIPPFDEASRILANPRERSSGDQGVDQGKDLDQGSKEKAPRKRVAPAIQKPDEVTDQVWSDWLELRKAKRAPVTQTVVDGAASEAAKAGMTLDGFLSVWCSRGSQGLQAEWIKPHERTAGQLQSFKDGDRRKAAENIAAWTGGLAHDRSALGGPIPGLQTSFVIEGEAYEQRQIAG
jgi:hypothetical protein